MSDQLPSAVTKITVEVGLRPFQVPGFVQPEKKLGLRQDGIQFSDGIPLADLPEDTLAALCDEFRAGVFQKAGKQDPRKGGVV